MKKALAVILAFFILAAVSAIAYTSARPQETSHQSVKADEPAGLRAGPQSPRERTAVYTLLAWVWLCVGVLLWIVHLMVREADRVFRMRFHTSLDKKSPRPRTP